MFKPLLEDAGLTPEICASLLGINSRIFNGWLNGTRDLPGYIIPELASVLGVSEEDLIGGQVRQAPAIWFKFRGDSKISKEDRELILLIRRLGFYAHQLDIVTSSPTHRWKVLFNIITSTIQRNLQASPTIQGAEAAKAFRDAFDLGFPRKTEQVSGNGDIVRPRLRSYGILIIEAPIPNSKIEGCSFYVGAPGEERPCLFVNTYEQSWFRRNQVLMHELAHAIFDISSEAASIDYRDEDSEVDVKEVRADSFAGEALLPKEMLRHLQSMLGLHWEMLSTNDLAMLTAYSQVELGTVLRKACEHGFIDQAHSEIYRNVSIHDELKAVTERALTTVEFAETYKEIGSLPSVSSRMTTIPARALRLPVPYIARVLNAVKDGVITEAKAAELLMIDDDTFSARFGNQGQDAAA